MKLVPVNKALRLLLVLPAALGASEPVLSGPYDIRSAQLGPRPFYLVKDASARCCTSDITLAELKSAAVQMPFDGFIQEDYAEKLIREYRDMAVPATTTFYANCKGIPALKEMRGRKDGRDDRPVSN